MENHIKNISTMIKPIRNLANKIQFLEKSSNNINNKFKELLNSPTLALPRHAKIVTIQNNISHHYLIYSTIQHIYKTPDTQHIIITLPDNLVLNNPAANSTSTMLDSVWQKNAAILQNTVGLPTDITQSSVDFLNKETSNDKTHDKLQQINQHTYTLKHTLGKALSPILEKFLFYINKILSKLINWTKQNTTLSSQLFNIAGIIVATVIAIGALATIITNVIAPFAMLRYAVSLLGIESLGIIAGIKLLGSSISWIGRLLLASPINLIVTAIALSAYVIHRHWAPIKDFFSRLWDNISIVFSDNLTYIKQMLIQFKQFINRILNGLLDSLKNKLDYLKQWGSHFKKILHLEKYRENLQILPKKILPLALSASLATTQTTVANSTQQSQSLLAPAAGIHAHSAQPISQHIAIHVHPTPNMNEQEIAKAIRDQLVQQQHILNNAQLYDGVT